MLIKYVEINNILSISQAKINFDDTGLLLLDGWNFDDNSSNGAGKTAIFNALSFGLYGKFPRHITTSEILRKNTKKGSVKVGIDTASGLLEVIRSRPKQEQYFLDGQEITMTQEEFELKLGLSYQQYLISMYAAQTEGTKLISLNDTGKKDFFLKLMNLDEFKLCQKDLDQSIKSFKNEIHKTNILQAKASSQKEVYQSSLIDVQEVQNIINQLDTTELEQQLTNIQDIDEPDTKDIDALESKLNSQLNKINNNKYKIQTKTRELNRLHNKLKQLESTTPSLTNSIMCPHCQEIFSLSGKNTLTIDDIKKHHEEEILITKNEIEVITEETTSYQSVIQDEDKVKALIKKCQEKHYQAFLNFNEISKKRIELKSKIKNNLQQKHHYEQQISNNKVIEDKINKIKQLEIKLNKQLNTLNDSIQLHETILTMVSPTGAPAYIMDTILDQFNTKVAHYVSMVWPNAQYRMTSYKETKSGDVRAKFSEKLIIIGKDTSVGALSGGEFRLLSLAIDFAIIDTLESIYGRKLSPVILDEPFEGLAANKRELVVELLEKIAANRQIIVVDHASEAQSKFSTIIKVEKRNGVSTLV